MRGKITIELTRRDATSESATDLPTLAFDAAVYAKEVPKISWKDNAGIVHRMSEWYELTAVRTSTEADPIGAQLSSVLALLMHDTGTDLP